MPGPEKIAGEVNQTFKGKKHQFHRNSSKILKRRGYFVTHYMKPASFYHYNQTKVRKLQIHFSHEYWLKIIGTFLTNWIQQHIKRIISKEKVALITGRQGWLNTQKTCNSPFYYTTSEISKMAPCDGHFQAATLFFRLQIFHVGSICWLRSNKQNTAEITGYHFWEKIIERLWLLYWYLLTPIPSPRSLSKAKSAASSESGSVERCIYEKDCQQPHELSLQVWPQPLPLLDWNFIQDSEPQTLR